MLDAIIGWLVALGAGALALWGVRWKVRANRVQQKIDDYQRSSDQWEIDARKRIEAIRKQAAGEAPIDPKDRKEFK